MSLRQLIPCVFLAVVFSVPAATLQLPTLTAGTVTYTNVKVIGANKTDLYFTHDAGIGNVKLRYLGADLQKRFNYDATAAAEAERKQAEADMQYQIAVASNLLVQAEKARLAKGNSAPEPETLADPVSDKSLLGKPAPALEVEKWIGEKPALEGKFVLVSFWAPWSRASRQCIPDLNTLQKKFAGKLAVVGVTSTPEADVEQMSAPKIEFHSAIDTKAKLSTTAGVVSLPCVMLIDPKGVVWYQGHPAAVTEKKLQAILAAHSE